MSTSHKNSSRTPDKVSLLKELRQVLLKDGAAYVLCGDLTELPPEVRDGFPRCVSIGVPLNPNIVQILGAGPSKEYEAEYDRVNDIRAKLARTCADFLLSHGYQAEALPNRLSRPDERTLASILPHKTAATRAGAGWIGKCALLVTKSFGSAVRLVSVLTNAELPVEKPINRSFCGKCNICVEACPAKAPSGKNWAVGMTRNDFYDVEACHQKTISFMKQIGLKHTICGICIAVCPWTKKYIAQALKKPYSS